MQGREAFHQADVDGDGIGREARRGERGGVAERAALVGGVPADECERRAVRVADQLAVPAEGEQGRLRGRGVRVRAGQSERREGETDARAGVPSQVHEGVRLDVADGPVGDEDVEAPGECAEPLEVCGITEGARDAAFAAVEVQVSRFVRSGAVGRLDPDDLVSPASEQLAAIRGGTLVVADLEDAHAGYEDFLRSA